MRGEQRRALDVNGRAAKGILEGGNVMNLDADHSVNADRLEERRDVASGDRIERLGAPVLAGIAKVGHHCTNAARTSIAQGAAKEKQAAQLIVCALPVVPV